MRLVLAPLAVLAGILSTPAAAHTAAVETCQGKPATIVQFEGFVQGTDGDDVIVGGSTTRVLAFRGDDTICVTGGRVDGAQGTDSIEMRGGDGDDFIEVSNVEVIDILLRAGQDRARLQWGRNAAGTGTVDGGSGRDFLTVMARSSVLVHLGAERVKVGPSAHLRAPGFKFAAADAPTVSMWGDRRGNELFGYACDARLSGGAGPDRLIVGTGGRSCPGRVGQELRGNSGDDRLFGGASDDVLLGGPGADRANGYKGTDECDAEIEKNCERQP